LDNKLKSKLPEEMFGSMNKREKNSLFETKQKRQKVEKTSDDETIQWDPELDVAKEKSRAFDVLAKLVP
jgi:hypothetical protein